MPFEFATAGHISFGMGAAARIGALAAPFGARALLVTGRDPSRADLAAVALSDSNLGVVRFSVSGEPGIDTVRQGVALALEEKCDLVVGFGGGSVLDTAKAVAAMLANEGPVEDYLEIIGRGCPLAKPSVPFIAVPTTAGTGSEVTRNAVLASPAHRLKVSLRSPFMLPRLALVDPGLTFDLPPSLTASTGLDALTQLIEPYVCIRANPLTDGFCVEGLRFVARSLPVAFKHGQDATAREETAAGSLLGGLALANAGLGAVHGLAGPIGGMFPAPHGAVCAALLPHVIAENLRALRQRRPSGATLRRFDEIGRLLTGRGDASADDGLEWVQNLVMELQIPPLRHYGVKLEDAEEIVRHAINASSMKANPIWLTPGELTVILENAI